MKNKSQEILSREVVIKLENISKTFVMSEKSSIRERVFSLFVGHKKRKLHALKNVEMEIRKGEFIGVIGRNGSGKSTLLKIVMGAIPPDKGGKVTTHGRIIRLSLGMGFDPNLSARENIYVNASILGLTFKDINEKFDEIIDFAELHDFIETKVKFFSRGMRSRLGFAIAVHAEADIFLMDEFFGGVGDANFKKKSVKVFQQAFVEGRTIIHVSHQLNTIEKYCDRVLVLHKGEVVALGKPDEVIPIYEEVLGKTQNKKLKKTTT